MNKGRFITLEGGEGAGKSTQLSFICELIRSAGHDVIQTREPGGTPRAERVRELLLENTEESMPVECELLLMFAARATHLHNLILPALARGTWVVCDRFTDASYAYQGSARGVPARHLDALVDFVQGSVRPDLTLLLDTPVDVGLARARARAAATQEETDRFEREQTAFFERVRAGYMQIARHEPRRVHRIDAAQSLEHVSNEVRQVVTNFLKSQSP